MKGWFVYWRGVTGQEGRVFFKHRDKAEYWIAAYAPAMEWTRLEEAP